MKFTIEEYAAMIEGSKYRKKAENAMRTFFGGTDLRKVDHPNLELFLQDVLPRLIPDMLGGEADERK